VEAQTGDELWAFGADDSVNSPIVVNGTVYVGSDDGNLYAVDAGVAGSSETGETGTGDNDTGGTETGGNNTDGTEAGGNYTSGNTTNGAGTRDNTTEQSESEDGDSVPGFGIGSAVTAIGATGYMLKRRLTDDTE